MRKRVVRDALGIVAAMIFLVFLTEVFADGPIPIFVSPTGTDSPTCGTEASPCKTITYAFQNFYSKGYLNVMAGTYNESLDLYHDVIIKGAGAATTIIAGNGDTSQPTIVSIGSKVEMSGVTVKGGAHGLYTVRALVEASNCTFSGNLNDGAHVSQNSALKAQSCTFNGNKGRGLAIMLSSSVLLDKCIVNLNKQHGVEVRQSSSAELTGNTIKTNTINGAAISLGSTARLKSNTISGNKQIGLIVHRKSAAELQGGNKITANGSSQLGNAGIGVYNASQVYFQKGSVKDSIANNNGHGISVFFNGDLYADDNSVTITGNKGDGLNLGHDSGAQLGNEVAITGNQGWGISGNDALGDSKYSGNPMVTGNTAGQINCQKYW